MTKLGICMYLLHDDQLDTEIKWSQSITEMYPICLDHIER